MFSRLALFALATLAPLVSAHGGLSGVFIDGQYLPAPLPSSGTGTTGDFAIREINDINPVKGTDNPDISCGHGARPAPRTANARPGSTIAFAWANGERGPWVHNTGPVLTYMAPCGDGGCAAFDSANAKWIKISQLGKHDDDRTWFMADLTGSLNNTLSATLPTDLPAGEYLVRHELIAMQLGMTQGGAEFYPACLQISLSAPSRTAVEVPAGVSLPGAYKDTDPGIWDQNIYNPGSPYTFPGPALFESAEAAPTESGPSGTVSSTDGTPASSSTTSSAASAPTGNGGCGGGQRKKKRVVKRIVQQGPLIKRHSKGSSMAKRQAHQRQAEVKRSIHQPTVRSRVMRGIN